MRKVCPRCLNKATECGKMPYLKVWYQGAGVRGCAVHKCQLLTMKKAYDMSTVSTNCFLLRSIRFSYI